MTDIIYALEIVKRRIERLNGFGEEAEVIDNAISLLKAQQPRVLTLEEVRNGNEIGYVEFKYHWEEGWVKCDFTTHNAENEVIMMFSASKTFYQNTEDYGALWRIWSMEPTIEQREAVKWDG